MAEHFRLVFLRSYDEETRIDEPVVDADYANCAVLCEQVDWNEFPYRERLPKDCATLRFPSLDFNALWPFEAVNPYNPRPGGRFLRGDRIVTRGIEQGMASEELLSYYLDGWEQYRIDMDRVLALERHRWAKRDERCDVKMGDEIFARYATERLFSPLTIAGFCPHFHTGTIELTCRAGDVRASVEAFPGQSFELHLPLHLVRGARAPVEIVASAVFNLLERGESEDNRDLSVLLVSIQAV